MGSRFRRAILKPKLGMAAAVLTAFALGAYLSGMLVKPTAGTSQAATYSAMRLQHAPKAGSSFTAKDALRPKRTRVFKPKPTPKTEPRPKPPTPVASASAAASPSASTPSSRPTSSSPPATSSPPTPSPPITSIRAGNVSCDYQQDTWSGDASGVGYSVQETQASNGRLASYTVILNANKGNTEVVGYPSEQCLTYSALPKTLTSSFDVTPPSDSNGLDYEYAFDIWLTTAAAATKYNWNNDLELMIWTYVNGQVPAGSAVATLSNGSKVWIAGNNTTGTVSVVLPKNETIGSVDIASIISQLKALGYIDSADTGILDVEYGVEAPYGGGQTFEVNGFSVETGS
jgi:hypothetical protein